MEAVRGWVWIFSGIAQCLQNFFTQFVWLNLHLDNTDDFGAKNIISENDSTSDIHDINLLSSSEGQLHYVLD